MDAKKVISILVLLNLVIIGFIVYLSSFKTEVFVNDHEDIDGISKEEFETVQQEMHLLQLEVNTLESEKKDRASMLFRHGHQYPLDAKDFAVFFERLRTGNYDFFPTKRGGGRFILSWYSQYQLEQLRLEDIGFTADLMRTPINKKLRAPLYLKYFYFLMKPRFQQHISKAHYQNFYALFVDNLVHSYEYLQDRENKEVFMRRLVKRFESPDLYYGGYMSIAGGTSADEDFTDAPMQGMIDNLHFNNYVDQDWFARFIISFWPRRYAEGNMEIVYRILKDIKSSYENKIVESPWVEGDYSYYRGKLDSLKSSNSTFAYKILQAGSEQFVRNGKIRLKKDTFQLAFSFSKDMAVYALATQDKEVFATYAKGKQISGPSHFVENPVEVSKAAKSKALFLSNDKANMWYYRGAKDHNFDIARQSTSILCTKNINSFQVLDNPNPSIKHMHEIETPLYLVLVCYRPGWSNLSVRESQRICLQILWD